MDVAVIDMNTFKFSPKYYVKVYDGELIHYVHKFSALKHNDDTTLFGEISIAGDSGVVHVNIYDLNRNIYAPFYYDNIGDYSQVLSKIYKNIEDELKKIRG